MDFLTVEYNWHFVLYLSPQNTSAPNGRSFDLDPCISSLDYLHPEQQISIWLELLQKSFYSRVEVFLHDRNLEDWRKSCLTGRLNFWKHLIIISSWIIFPASTTSALRSFLKQFLLYRYPFNHQAFSNHSLPKQKDFILKPHHREVPLPQTLPGAQKVIFLPTETIYITHPEAL